jgi:hypothetical protein
MTRNEALEQLLQPIIWPEWLTNEYVKGKVFYRLQQIRLVYPFLSDAEKLRADVWLETEQHLELWDEEPCDSY